MKNLLRVDIGFLVSRNESAQLLNNKISKVKSWPWTTQTRVRYLQQRQIIAKNLQRDAEKIR